MKVFLIVTRELDQNCYCCFDENAREGVIIDPSLNWDGIVTFLDKEKLEIKAILLTHGHYDHIMSAQRLRDLTHTQVYAHRDDAEVMADPRLNLSGMMSSSPLSLTPDKLLADGDEITFGSESLRVLHTPGHTPGGVCFYSAAHSLVFSGDTLFWESVGRTDFPRGDGRQLTESVREKLLTLPDDTIVYPGHGRPTDIGHERVLHEKVDMR